MVNETDEREEDCLAGGRLDDCGLSSARGVEIDVGAFFGSLCGDI